MGSVDELVRWTHEQKCKRAVESLQKNGFTATYCPALQEARDYVLREAEEARSVGFGGSMTIAKLNLQDQLREMGKEILHFGLPNLSDEERLAIMRRQLTCDLFLASCNAVTLSGSLVNIDATGNRVAAMIFGPQKVILVVGRNKLIDGDLSDAIRRVKEWATPPNARRLHFDTPCAKTGFCSDCNSPDRLCRATTIIERRPRRTDLHVLVVDEDLGF